MHHLLQRNLRIYLQNHQSHLSHRRNQRNQKLRRSHRHQSRHWLQLHHIGHKQHAFVHPKAFRMLLELLYIFLQHPLLYLNRGDIFWTFYDKLFLFHLDWHFYRHLVVHNIQYYSFLNYSLPLLNQFFNSTILPRFFIFGKKISTLFIRVLITL